MLNRCWPVILTIVSSLSHMPIAAAQTDCAAGETQVEYIGHAAFLVSSPEGYEVLIDPYASRIWIGYDFPVERFNPDIVLVTHPHYDHDGGEYRSGKPVYPAPARTFRWPGHWTFGDLEIDGFKGMHAEPYGKEFGQANTIWRVRVGGIDLLHLGDNGPLHGAAADLGPVDVLFLPADGREHIITHEQTTDILSSLQPSIVVPMHYRLDELEKAGAPDDLGNVADWIAARGVDFQQRGTSICVSPEKLPARQEIWTMRALALEQATGSH